MLPLYILQQNKRWLEVHPWTNISPEEELKSYSFSSFSQSKLKRRKYEASTSTASHKQGRSMNQQCAAAAKSPQSCPTLCDPINSSPSGSPVSGILQARTLEWVAISFSNAWKWSRSVVSDSSDPMDCSPPGSSIYGNLQARVLEWGAIAFSEPTVYVTAKKNMS